MSITSQILTAASDVIISTSSRIGISSTTVLKMVSVPTINDGTIIDQQIKIVNTGNKVIIFQNDDIKWLAGSKLKLRSSLLALAPTCSVSFYWDGSFWVEESRSTFGSPDIVNVLDYGADNTGTTDSSTAINLAIQSFGSRGGTFYGQGTIFLPPGKYKLSATILLDRSVVFSGAGPGYFYGTGLFPDVGVTAIKVQRQIESENPENLLIKQIEVNGPGTFGNWPGATAHGIDVHAAARIENVRISGMSGNGLRIIHDGPSLPDLCQARNVDIIYCGDHGVYVHGGDANAGVFERISVVGCHGWGINDDSFLGNTWIACHTNANVGAYRVGQAASYALLLGCYSEGGQGISEIGGNGSVVLGGDHGAGINGGAYTLREGGHINRFYLLSQPAGYDYKRINDLFFGDSDIFQSKNRFSIEFGGETYLGFASRPIGPIGYDLPATGDHAQPFGNSSWLAWYPGNGAITRSGIAHILASFKSQVTGAALYNRAIEPSATWMDFFYLGGSGLYGGNARRIASVHSNLDNLASIAPTWHNGDFIFNAYPVNAGDPLGWICSSSGTFGTYNEGLKATYLKTTGYGHVYDLSGATTVLKIGDRISINNVSGTISDLVATRDQIVFSSFAGNGSNYTMAYQGPPTFKAVALLENVAGTIVSSGKLGFSGGNSSVSPGNATIDKVVGKAAIAVGTSTVTISNSLVQADDLVFITPLDNDTTLTTWKVTISNGQFVVTGNANASANWKFQFMIVHSV